MAFIKRLRHGYRRCEPIVATCLIHCLMTWLGKLIVRFSGASFWNFSSSEKTIDGYPASRYHALLFKGGWQIQQVVVKI
jgi:hypothetical protein